MMDWDKSFLEKNKQTQHPYIIQYIKLRNNLNSNARVTENTKCRSHTKHMLPCAIFPFNSSITQYLQILHSSFSNLPLLHDGELFRVAGLKEAETSSLRHSQQEGVRP